MANEIEKRNEAFLIYQDENGIARVNVRFEGEDVWLNVEQIPIVSLALYAESLLKNCIGYILIRHNTHGITCMVAKGLCLYAQIAIVKWNSFVYL